MPRTISLLIVYLKIKMRARNIYLSDCNLKSGTNSIENLNLKLVNRGRKSLILLISPLN